jgi:hypothetical protein
MKTGVVRVGEDKMWGWGELVFFGYFSGGFFLVRRDLNYQNIVIAIT